MTVCAFDRSFFRGYYSNGFSVGAGSHSAGVTVTVTFALIYPGSSLWRLQHLLLLFLAVLFLTVAGCWRDGLPGKRQFKLSFHGTSLADGDAIREIELFVFDDQQQLINRATGTIGETISLDYPSPRPLHYIAWGNSNDKSLRLPT